MSINELEIIETTSHCFVVFVKRGVVWKKRTLHFDIFFQ